MHSYDQKWSIKFVSSHVSVKRINYAFVDYFKRQFHIIIHERIGTGRIYYGIIDQNIDLLDVYTNYLRFIF